MSATAFIRHIFSGFVAVVLFEVGRYDVSSLKELSAKDLTSGEGFSYTLVALVVGIVIYLFERYFLCELFMIISEYLINSWSWSHATGSVGLTFILVPLFTSIFIESIIYRWYVVSICIIFGILLLLAYLNKIIQLLCIEKMAYNDYKPISNKKTEQKKYFLIYTFY